MAIKTVLLLTNNKTKAEILQRSVYEYFDASYPISLTLLPSNTTAYAIAIRCPFDSVTVVNELQAANIIL